MAQHIVEYIFKLTDKISGPLTKVSTSAANLNGKFEKIKPKISSIGKSVNSLHEKIRMLEEKRNSSTAVKEIRRLNGEIRNLERQADKLKNMPPKGFINGFRYAHGGLIDFMKTAATTYGVMKLFSGITAFTKLGMDMEQTRAKFSVLLGTAEKGNKMITDIGNMAKTTPLGRAALTDSATTLLAFNVAGEKIIPTLKMLGDIAMGDKNKMQGLTLAYAQMTSAGRLMGQDLLQMINQGFNPLVEISKMTGESLEVLRDKMSKGAISTQMVEDAFRHATSEGGQFYGMMDKMAETTQGKLTKFFGTLRDRLTEYAEKILPFVNGIIDLGTNFLNVIVPVLNAFIEGISQISGFLMDNKIALFAVIGAIGLYRLAAWKATLATKGWTIAQRLGYIQALLSEKAFKLLHAAMSKTGFFVAIAAITAVIGALSLFRKKTREAAGAQSEFNKRAADLGTDYYTKEKNWLDEHFRKMEKTNAKSKERIRLVDELLKKYKDLNPELAAELKNTNDLSAAKAVLIQRIQQEAIAEGMKEILKEKSRELGAKELEIARKENNAAEIIDRYGKEKYESLLNYEKGVHSGQYQPSMYDDSLGALNSIRNKIGKVAPSLRDFEDRDRLNRELESIKAAMQKSSLITGNNFLADSNFTSGSENPLRTVEDLTAGGARETNIHINFRNVMEGDVIMYPQTVSEGVDNMSDKLIEGLLRVVNSTNRIAAQ